MATLERPRSGGESAAEKDPAPAVSRAPAKPAPVLPSNPEEAVEHLEKRLEGLGGMATPVVDDKKAEQAAPAPKPAVAAPAPAPAPAAAQKQAGRSALLVSVFAHSVGFHLFCCSCSDERKNRVDEIKVSIGAVSRDSNLFVFRGRV